jgi:photosystem II stability/assembly factor-like uncharacterized protein
MAHKVEAMRISRVRGSLALLLCCVYISGCANLGWSDLEPHYTSNSSPAKITWRELNVSLYSIFGTSDGRSLWAVGAKGTILHSADGEHWTAQTSGTQNFLSSIFGTSDGRSLWAVGAKGTILHSADGERWTAQTSGTQDLLHSIFGTSDGRSLWAVGEKGTILHSADGEHWTAQTSGTQNPLSSIYGTSDGRSLWAVGEKGTILHSADGEHWTAQTSGTQNDLTSIFGTSDGRSLWAVGDKGTILHSADGEPWTAQTSGTQNFLSSIFGTSDGRSLWAVGDKGTILHSADGEHWTAQTSGTQNFLSSIFGTSDGRSLWAVGAKGTILHSADGEHWTAQTNGTQNDLTSIFGTSDGRSLWAVGEKGTILHSADGEPWTAQTSGTQNDLTSIFGTSDGRSLWAVGDKGTILRSADGEHWTAQTSGTQNYLFSIFGTGDGRSLWAVCATGTILHSADGEHWTAQTSGTQNPLRSIYGTSDGRSLWAVGGAGRAKGTILHSADGEHWTAQTSGTQDLLHSIFGTSDGRSLWAVGDNGTILYSADDEHWTAQTSGTQNYLFSIFGTGDGRSLWAVGDKGTILRGSTAGHYPYIAEARIARRGILGTQLEWQVVCPDGNSTALQVDVAGRNHRQFEIHRPGVALSPGGPGSGNCNLSPTPFNPADIDVRPGEKAYFDVTFSADGSTQRYEYHEVYDPWYWFRKNWPWVAAVASALSVLAGFIVFLYVKPLWNIHVYRALKLAQIDKLSIPGIGPPLQFALKVFTVLPLFVTHPRTLDAWVNAHRRKIGEAWGPDAQPENAQDGSHAPNLYVPLPIRIGSPNSGEMIQEPDASRIGSLFSSERAVVEIVGAGGAGKTTLARQIGRWSLESGRPGGFPGHPMAPVWIDEELDSADHTLIKTVKGKLAAILPDEEIEGDILNALLRKQRIVVIVDRLSERSAATQAHVTGIYTSTRVEALVITTRTQLRPVGSDPISLYPQPLNASNLVKFMLALIEDWVQHRHAPGQGGKEPEGALAEVPFSSPEDQLALGQRLAQLFRSAEAGDEKATAILPLPVRLFVQEAIRLLNTGRSLDELPVSLPDVYLRYLERVNPEDPMAKNFMTNEDSLRAGMVLAKVALGDDFIPKEFFKDDARDALKQDGWTDQTKTDPIQRMFDNGILLEKTVVGHRRLRFVLDPVAENLAASAYVRQCKGDVQCLDELTRKASVSLGFQSAVKLARKAWESK